AALNTETAAQNSTASQTTHYSCLFSAPSVPSALRKTVQPTSASAVEVVPRPNLLTFAFSPHFLSPLATRHSPLSSLESSLTKKWAESLCFLATARNSGPQWYILAAYYLSMERLPCSK